MAEIIKILADLAKNVDNVSEIEILENFVRIEFEDYKICDFRGFEECGVYYMSAESTNITFEQTIDIQKAIMSSSVTVNELGIRRDSSNGRYNFFIYFKQENK